MNTLRTVVAALYLLLAVAAPVRAADRLDPVPRIAVMSAYEPEWKALKANIGEAKSHNANGVEFVTGTLAGRKVVLFLSGVSMVNAAMSSQLALERFDITGIVVSGIAGGVDPGLHIGDVGRRTLGPVSRGGVRARDRRQIPAAALDENAISQLRHDLPDECRRAHCRERDGESLLVRGRCGHVGRRRQDRRCPAQALHGRASLPGARAELVVGGNGVSGPTFVDNAQFRQYVFGTFKAQVLDMESAAVAMVAYANGVPFIAFRSLSDLAGGGEGANQLRTFMQLASDNSAAVVQRFLTLWTPPR